jgi:hypothetical protein
MSEYEKSVNISTAYDHLKRAMQICKASAELFRRSMSSGLSFKWFISESTPKFKKNRPKPIRIRTRKQLNDIYKHKYKKFWNRKMRRKYAEYYKATHFGK